jgi:hypothetical protein
MRTFVFFFEAVAYQWWTLAAFVSTVVAIIGFWWNKPFGISRKWFWRVALLLLLVACYAAWRDQYWSTQGWVGANNNTAAKFQDATRRNDELKSENRVLSSQVGALQTQLAMKERLVATAARSAPGQTVTQQSGGNNSPNIVGNQNQVTIGAVPPPSRTLTGQQLAELKAYASIHTAKILIVYTQGDAEAYRLAKQIGDTLAEAGWTLKQPIASAMFFSEGGPPQYGTMVSWKGDAVPPSSRVHLDTSTPWGTLASFLQQVLPEDAYVNPAPGMEPDSVTLDVFPNPKSKPGP